jgi:membrane protein DedA with SNARE-associated domain
MNTSPLQQNILRVSYAISVLGFVAIGIAKLQHYAVPNAANHICSIAALVFVVVAVLQVNKPSHPMYKERMFYCLVLILLPILGAILFMWKQRQAQMT